MDGYVIIHRFWSSIVVLARPFDHELQKTYRILKTFVDGSLSLINFRG